MAVRLSNTVCECHPNIPIVGSRDPRVVLSPRYDDLVECILRQSGRPAMGYFLFFPVVRLFRLSDIAISDRMPVGLDLVLATRLADSLDIIFFGTVFFHLRTVNKMQRSIFKYRSVSIFLLLPTALCSKTEPQNCNLILFSGNVHCLFCILDMLRFCKSQINLAFR